MMLAEAHLPPGVSIPVAVVMAIWMLWYWKCLGRAGLPDSRRRIRRSSLAVMLSTLPVCVQGVSFLDFETQPNQYAITWLLIIFLLGLVLVTAALDTVNTLRLASRVENR